MFQTKTLCVLRRENLRKLLFAAVLLVFAPASAGAASELGEIVQKHFEAGQSAAAVQAAEARLAAAAEDEEARFAFGAAQFVRAVERLGQSLYRYGLAASGGPSFGGMSELPFLRLPIPPNPEPEQVSYEALRGMLRIFVGDLEQSERTLAGMTGRPFELPLDIGLIRLDFNDDGQTGDHEDLWRIVVTLAGLPWPSEATANQLLVDFDESDVPWLQAYCHLLMAMAEFLLAHDWEPAFDATFHAVFPQSDLPSSALNTAPAELGDFSSFAGTADLIAFLHLNHWPVVEPERMRSVLAHLEAMPRLSRENWRRVLAETDDGSEWLPSPKQSGALPGLRVTQQQVDAWMLFLDEFEALLQGRKLLPHWRFDRGINLRRMFLEPTTFDIVLLIQGSAAIPYLEDGEPTTRDTWARIVRLFGGDFFRYAIWFN
jgi:hypothetical protein